MRRRFLRFAIGFGTMALLYNIPEWWGPGFFYVMAPVLAIIVFASYKRYQWKII